MGSSYNQHKTFLKAFKRRFIDVGKHCHNMYAARTMCQIIYESLNDEFMNDLRQSDEPVTLIGTIQIL